MANNKKKVAIIGAGPAGLSCGFELISSGFEVEIFESEDDVGGICKSLKLLDQIVDIGPHKYYTQSKRVSDFWKSHIKKEDYLSQPRTSTLFYKDKFYTYPLKGLEPLFKLGVIESIKAIASYVKYKLFPSKGDSFEDYMINAFGKRLFEIFFKTFSKKVWDVDTTQIDRVFASQRIQKMDLFQTIKHALVYSLIEKGRIQSRFTCSRYGSGVIYENIASDFESKGGVIHKSCNVSKILTDNKTATGIEYLDKKTGEVRKANFDVVVSTAIFKEMLMAMDEVDSAIKEKAKLLSYRSTVLVYLEVDKESKLKDSWCYILSPEIRTGRFTNFASWSVDMKLGNEPDVLSLEYWCGYNDAFWNKSDEELIKMAKDDLVLTKLVDYSQLYRGAVVRVKDSYPTFPLHYSKILDPIYAHISSYKNLYFIGRGGSHRYNNQDHSVLMGLLCADKIKGDDSIDVWAVNTDPAFQEDKLVD